MLVRLDTRQEHAQLAAAEAQRDLAKLNLDRATELVEQRRHRAGRLDRASAEAKQAEAQVGEIRATIERKTIRAPFAGGSGIRQVNLGQFLDDGDPIVSLQSLDPIYVDFSLPQQQAGRAAASAGGRRSRPTPRGRRAAPGKITAINPEVDVATRNVQVQATVAQPDGALRPGMFVETDVVPASAPTCVVAPGHRDHLRALRRLGLRRRGREGRRRASRPRPSRQQFVRLGPARGDFVAVLDGLKAGRARS